MKSSILDASALLALVRKEPGADIVRTHLAQAAITSVNLSEAAAVLNHAGMESGIVRDIFTGLMLCVFPFDEELAYQTAALRTRTESHGLGLGDRACLAAGLVYNFPVLTADQKWRDLKLGVEIQFIRDTAKAQKSKR